MFAARIWSLRGAPRAVLVLHFGQQLVSVPLVERAYLDRQPGSDCGELGPLQGRVQVGGADDPESAEVFLGLRVRPVADKEAAARLAHDGRRLREQAASEHERTGVRQLVVEGAYVGERLPPFLR